MKTSNKLSQLSFIITREFRAISTSYAVLLVLMGGIFVYGLLYNYMYAPNIVTKAPIAVVDNSHSSLSRQYIRWLNATPQIEIYAQAMDYHEAQEWMKEGKIQGILYLPTQLRRSGISRRRSRILTLCHYRCLSLLRSSTGSIITGDACH